MNPLWGLAATWALVTAALIVLYAYRSRLESKETDWIPLTEDAREDQAVHEQEVIEKKVHKFDRPIQALGALSLLLLLTMVAFWVYQGLTTRPPLPQ